MHMPKLDIVIPAAGLGRRMKSFGPKPLIPVGPGGEPIIARQIRLLTALYPDARVVVVVGHESDRVRRALPPGVRVVTNRQFATTNVARSLRLGLAATAPTRPALVVYGDLVFAEPTVGGIPLDSSCVVVDDGGGRPDEVGVNVVAGKAVHFSYGLDSKWAHVALLAPREKGLFLSACRRPSSDNFFGFEVLNAVLDAGGQFDAVVRPTAGFVEVDTSKDAERIAAIA